MTLNGTVAVRHIVAVALADLDDLGIVPRSVRVDLWRDGEPQELNIWFGSYADLWAYQQRVGLPPVTKFNGDSDSPLIACGLSPWETGLPDVAGVRVGVRLIADRPAVTA